MPHIDMVCVSIKCSLHAIIKISKISCTFPDGEKTSKFGTTTSPFNITHTIEISDTTAVHSEDLENDESKTSISMETTLGNVINPVLMIHLKLKYGRSTYTSLL